MPRYTQEQRFDHKRDLAKHEPRPGEKGYIPDRLDKPLTTAMDIVVLVKMMANYTEAAELIDWYVEAKAAEQRLEAVAAGAHP